MRNIVVRKAISTVSPTLNAPGQPSWTSRSIQPLCADGTGHWVSARIHMAGMESRPQKAW